MSPKSENITRRQYMGVLFVALLSQHIRVVPRALAGTAGRAAWLAPIAAVPLIALYLLFIRSLLAKKREGYSLCDLITDALGHVLGRILIFVISLWMVFYAGFLLHNIADRFIATVYPYSAAWVFVVATGGLCLLACLGRFTAVARCAMVFRPLLVTIIFLVLLLSLANIDKNCLLPITTADALPVGKAALSVLNIVGLVAYMGFLEGETEGSVRFRDYLLWMGVLLVISFLLCVCCIGMYGAELTSRATLPVFLLARDLLVFGSVERVEPIIITIWVLCDFVLISTVLSIATKNLRRVFAVEGKGEGLFDLRHGRWLIPACLAAAVVLGLTLGKDIVSMDLLSEKIVPGINLLVILIILPLIFVIGRLRKKI